MIWKTMILLLGLVFCAQARRIPTSDQKCSHQEQSSEINHIGSHKPEHHEEYAWSYPSYDFSYSVHDPHTHDQKGQQEKRHGDEVEGEYWLVQPDGKKRTVQYKADDHKGFTAHVQYSDHHHHEEPRVEEIVEEKEPEKIEVKEVEGNEEDERKEESEVHYRPLMQKDHSRSEPANDRSLVLRVTQFNDGTEELSPIHVDEIRAERKRKPIINYRRYHRAQEKQQYN